MALRAVIVDDDAHFIDAARRLLEREGIVVAGVASCSSEALRMVAAVQPDVALIDLDLGEESGLKLAHRFHLDHAELPPNVILISAHAEGDFAELVEASPALGFLSKSELSAQAIRELLTRSGDARYAA